jgi:hypothetical protein
MRIITALALISFTPAAMAADTLDIKEGLWETTSTLAIEGLQIPPALLQSLPDEQRAQFERMDGRPRIEHACVTQKDIAAGFDRFDKQSGCTRSTAVSTPRHFEAGLTCTGLFTGTGAARVDATSPTRVQGSATLQGMLGNMSMTLDARWLSASCGALKK